MRLVDTTFLIDLLNDEPAVRPLVAELDRYSDHHTTAISHFELMTGAHLRGKGQVELCTSLLSSFEVIPFDTDSSEEAASIYRELKNKGSMIPMNDIMIGGIARSKGFVLMTRDTAHFKRIKGLDIGTW
jgi:predicted nucleic acid-binding protein